METVATQVLEMIDHHVLFILLLQLSVLLVAAKFFGEMMVKLGQPAIVGELLAGVILGPSIFGLAFPELQATIFPHDQLQFDLLSVVSWIGVLFLLIVTGLETDLQLVKKVGKKAILVSFGGISITFITEYG